MAGSDFGCLLLCAHRKICVPASDVLCLQLFTSELCGAPGMFRDARKRYLANKDICIWKLTDKYLLQSCLTKACCRRGKTHKVHSKHVIQTSVAK